MKNTKVVFMGTPLFAVPVLEMLIENTNVLLVVTQPDKVVGRKKELKPSPVKELAIQNEIPVFQPENIKIDYQKIIDAEPDLIITCAYGQIIPEVILNTPKIGSFNVHASLLPKYRGGAPIQRAIMNGEETTGITIMYMDKFMDAGDIVEQKETPIFENDNLFTLSEKLSIIGRDLLLEVLPMIIKQTNNRIKQDETKVTFAKIIKREEERVCFTKKGQDIINQIRGLYPLANMLVNDEEFKILEASFTPKENPVVNKVSVTKDSIGIDCFDGTINITRLKPFGKKEMNTKDYLNGVKKENVLNFKIN